MKNERMSLIVWSFCFLCLPIFLHRHVHHFCMLVLPAKDQHTSGILLPFLLLQETEVSALKTVEVQMPNLIPIFDNVMEAKPAKCRLSSSLPPSHHTPSSPYLFKTFGNGPIQIWRSREERWKTMWVTKGILSPVDFWLQNTLWKRARASNTKCRSEQGSVVSPILYTSRGTALWAPAPFCNKDRPHHSYKSISWRKAQTCSSNFVSEQDLM